MDTKTSDSTKTASVYKKILYKNIPKTISYFFLLSQFIFGIDFGFSKLLSKNVQKFVRSFTIFVTLVYIVAMFAAVFVYPSFIISVIFPFCIEYSVNVIILFSYKKYNIYDFLCHISQFCKFTKIDKYILVFISVINYITAFSVNTIFFVTFTVNDLKFEPHFKDVPEIFHIVLVLFFSILDLAAISLIIIFYYEYSSMKHLKFKLTSSYQKLKFISKQYKAIIDICENIRPLSDSLVSNIIFLF